MLGEFPPGGRVVGLTKGQFSLGDLIRAVLAKIGPSDVVVSTWTTGLRDAEHARWLVDTKQMRSLRFLVDRSFVTRQPQYAQRMLHLFGANSIRIVNTHAKFVLLSNEDWHVVVLTSMNLNQNKRFETFDVCDDREMFGFFSGLVAELEELTPTGFVTESECHAAYKAALEGKAETRQKRRRSRRQRKTR